MKKVRVCFGLGLNFAGVPHQVMSPASRWFSGCFGEGAWLALELLLMSCWFKGCLCFAFLSALLHTHHTHTQKNLPFHFPSAPRALYMCTVVVSGFSVAAFGAGAAAQRVLIQSLCAANHTPLWSLRAVLQNLSLESGLAGVSWKLKGSALGQGFLSICYCSSKSQRSWSCPDCRT